MKTSDSNSAYPGMADFYVEYNGTLVNEQGTFGDGISYIFPITTEIRRGLIVIALCQQIIGEDEEIETGGRKFPAYYGYTTGLHGILDLKIEVPNMCRCTYKISGYKNVEEPLHPEVGTPVLSLIPQHLGGHRHDGTDGHKILYSDLEYDGGLHMVGYINGSDGSGEARIDNGVGGIIQFDKPSTGTYTITKINSFTLTGDEQCMIFVTGTGVFLMAGINHLMAERTSDNVVTIYSVNSDTGAADDYIGTISFQIYIK